MGITDPAIMPPSETARTAELFSFRQSEELLRNIMENAAVGMALVDTEGRVIHANRAYSDMFGYTPSECIGLRASDLVDPAALVATRGQLSKLISGEIDGYRAERRYIRKDRSLFWGLTSASIVRTGRPLYVIIQISDIDGQKQAEAALAQSESRWNFALESAGQGVWDHDLKRGHVFYSRMWRLMRGFGPGEEIDGSQQAWLARVHPDDRERILLQVQRQDSGDLTYNAFEYRERHRDGHWIWILSRGKPVEWMPDGSVARIIGTDTDITSLKSSGGTTRRGERAT
jgi:PAS domain S-box-containing protein